MAEKIQAFDNGGRTFNRYTIVIDRCIFSMSSNPLSKGGFNKYAGNLSEIPIEAYWGKRVSINSLPKSVRIAIRKEKGNIIEGIII